MLELAPVITKLTTEVPALARISGAAELDRVLDSVTALPAAYLLPGAEGPDGQNHPNVARQIIEERLTVVLAVRNVSDSQGAAALDDLREIINEVRKALIGWRPTDETPPDRTPLVWVGGDPVGFTDQVLLWAEHYSTRGTVIAS